MRRKGFTLIELLIVVAILAFLMTAVFYSVIRYLNQSRDSVRKTNLEKYRVVLEEYYNDHHRYPPATAFQNCGSSDLEPYLPGVLCDPLSKKPYTYETDQKGTYYHLYTTLAITDDPTIKDHGCQTGCGPDNNKDGKGDFNYGITDEQGAVGTSFQTVVPAKCDYGGGHYLCSAGVCGNCCPGSGYRCNGTGDGCYLDSTCGK